MKKIIIGLILRHATSAFGVLLVNNGLATGQQWQDIVGGVIALAAVLHSLYAKYKNGTLSTTVDNIAKGLSVVAILFFLTASARADVTTNTVAFGNGPTNLTIDIASIPVTPVASLPSKLYTILGDGWQSLKSVDFSQGVTARPFGMYIKSVGFGGGVLVENVQTNNILHVGFVVAALDVGGLAEWYDGGLTVSITGHETLPIVGDVELSAVSGPVFNLNDGTMYTQTLTHAQKTWIINPKLSISAGGGFGYLSKYASSYLIEFDAAVTYTF